MPLADDPALPSLLPPVPRPITSRASWRTWSEMGVRAWVIVTLAVVLAGVYVTTTRLQQAFTDRWLILNGTQVNAKVLKGYGLPTPKRLPRREPIPAQLEIKLPDKEPVVVDVIVDARQDSFLQVGGELPIRVDPNDPYRWTEETVPRPWLTELVVPLMLVPLIAVVMIVTLLKRRSVLRSWIEGDAKEAVVVDVRQTATAPASRAIRFSLADESDPRIFGLLLPTSAGIPEPGSRMWILARPNHPSSAVAAAMYVEQ